MKPSEVRKLFPFVYPDKELKRDWQKLIQWKPKESVISDAARIGLKLCEHFFPNFFDIEIAGKSFNMALQDDSLLEKVVAKLKEADKTLTAKSIKTQIYIMSGILRSTMFRPQLAKLITGTSKIVLDPCAGWGGRMLGTLANSNTRYIGFEPNPRTYEGLQEILSFLNLHDRAWIICDDALNMNDYDFPKADTILTSPPYFNLEVYCNNSKQSVVGKKDYTDWRENFLEPLIELCIGRGTKNVKSYWNTKPFEENDIPKHIHDKHESLGFNCVSSKFGIRTIARPNSKTGEDRIDITYGYALNGKTIEIPVIPRVKKFTAELEIGGMLSANMRITDITEDKYLCVCTDCGVSLYRGILNVKNSKGRINPHKCKTQ